MASGKRPRILAVTGAFGVLGTAVVEAAVKGGAKLALIDYGAHPMSGVAKGRDVLVLSGVDLTDPPAARNAVDTAAQHFGGLDALVNIAGGFAWEEHAEGSADTWRRMFAMNLETAANASRAAIPHLRKSPAGRIVNIGANGAVKAAAGMGAYAASKAGVHKLTEALAEELKADGITVNAVLPSIIDTPANRADMPKADFTTWVAPAELAAVILFLASEAASGVTGALLPVTGRV